tara:strand:- start:469 stop:588 length:120 start_codon:yes stop_codon:yes gene_type:complete
MEVFLAKRGNTAFGAVQGRFFGDWYTAGAAIGNVVSNGA